MSNIINIVWHPDRTEPVEAEATMQVDFLDNTQLMVCADTDVSELPQLIQDLKQLLF